MTQQFKVQGLKEVDEMLSEIPRALRRQVILRALRKGARPIAEEARARAPRGTDARKRGSKKDRKTRAAVHMGAGADSITVKPMKPKDEFRTSVAIGPDRQHFYLSFAEFGTSRQRKQPFMRPAFDMLAEQSIVPIGEDLIKAIEQTAARLARKAAAGTLSQSAQKALSS